MAGLLSAGFASGGEHAEANALLRLSKVVILLWLRFSAILIATLCDWQGTQRDHRLR